MAELFRKHRAMARFGAWIVVVIILAGGIAVGALFGTGALSPQGGQATLRVALPTFAAEVLDPSMDSQAGLRYHGHMFDHLLGATPDGRPSTQLGSLERWDSSPDAKKYTLTLKRGMRWHDSVEITSDDIEFSMAHYSREGAACAGCDALTQVLGWVQVVDRYTATLHLDEPDVAFMARLGPVEGDAPLLPKHHWEKVGDAGLAQMPLGSGPWKFVQRSPGRTIDYEANLDYWNAERVPGFDRLSLVHVPEEATRAAMSRTGSVDMAPVDLGDVALLKGDGFTIQGPKYVISTTLRFFMSYDPAFLTSRPEFRKALVLGMNLPSIIERVYPPEAATLATGSGLFSPLAEGYDPGLPPYPYDPALARQLLQESGYQDETVHLFSVAAYGLTEMPRLNEMIAEDWRRIGVDVRILPTDWPPVQARLLARPQQLDDVAPAPLFHGAAPNRPGGVLNAIRRYMSGADGSLLTYHDPEKGNRVYAKVSAIVDKEARKRWLQLLNREIYDEYWAAPIVWRHEVYALSPELVGWEPTDGTASDLHLETLRTAQ